jgi:tetratricopeptide (TPR) repeat protein
MMLLNLLMCGPLFAQGYRLSAEVLFAFGKAYLAENKYANAKIEFQQCLQLNPYHKEAKELLGWCENKLREDSMLFALKEAEKKTEPRQEVLENKPQEKDPFNPAMDMGKDINQLREAPKDKPSGTEFLSVPPQSGAWTRKKGEIYAESYTKYYWHNHQFDDKGKRRSWGYGGKGNEIKTELKLEYGLTDRYTLMFRTVHNEAHWKDDYKSCSKKGFVEAWPGVKYLLFKQPFICSLQGRLKLPFHYSEEAVPALGKHQIDADIKLLTAQSWPNLSGYTKFEFGFRGRAEEPANDIPYFFELGYDLTPKIVLKASIDGQEGLAPQAGGIDEDWTKGTFGPIIKIADFFNIEFGYGNTFMGKNTSAAQEVYLTLSSQW